MSPVRVDSRTFYCSDIVANNFWASEFAEFPDQKVINKSARFLWESLGLACFNDCASAGEVMSILLLLKNIQLDPKIFYFQ